MKQLDIAGIYQIFVRNFTPEGTFEAAARRLPGIRDMGFDWIYLAPIHPIGKTARKGSLGSPYAISDYRSINPDLGTERDFRAFLDLAHGLGLKVMMDVVFNHASPDSALAASHPDWFLRGPDGNPTRKCAEWTDVIDFDYGSAPHLWLELMDILVMWRAMGVDGFRCDVASLVPVDFWKRARQRVNQYDPGKREEIYPLLWLAESVRPRFLKRMRDAGHGAWSDPELHSVFDLSYDYDGWERLDTVLAGERSPFWYLEYLYAQETLFPADARKIRFLENHDMERAAARFPEPSRLKSWTVLSFFIAGVSFAYMGQECAIAHRPSLFDADPVDWGKADAAFGGFFRAALKGCNEAKAAAPRFSWRELDGGVVLLEREGGAGKRYAAVVDLGAGRGGRVAKLPFGMEGRNLLDGKPAKLGGEVDTKNLPVLLEL